MMKYPQLPEAELLVMQIVWEQNNPLTSKQLLELSKPQKEWKLQTVSTLLNRLTEKGFLTSEKRGKERYYLPVVVREEYLSQETKRFVKAFHKNSISGLMASLVSSNKVNDEDLQELVTWLKERKEGEHDDG